MIEKKKVYSNLWIVQEQIGIGTLREYFLSLYSIAVHCIIINLYNKLSKVKVIPLQAQCGPEGR